MEEYMILGLKEDNKFNGFYIDDAEGKEVLKNGGIHITIELWQYLWTLGLFKLKEEKENRMYTIDDKDLFETFELDTNDTAHPKSKIDLLEQKINIQEQTLLELSMMMGGK